MSKIKKLRLSLGFTQEQLAGYLSVSKAQVSMSESGRRALPTSTLVKLASLERHMIGNNSGRVTAEIQSQSVRARNILRAEAQNCNMLAATATHRLKAMRSQYQQCLKKFKVASGLLEELPAGAKTKKERLWLEILQAETLKKMASCGTDAQALLELQVDGFLYSAQQAQAKAKVI